MRKYILIAVALQIFGCTIPTPENECKDFDVFTTFKDMEKCLEKYSDSLRTEVKLLKLKIHYECTDTAQRKSDENYSTTHGRNPARERQ